MKKRKRHSPEQIVKKLRDADAMLAAGKSVEEVRNRTVRQAIQSTTTAVAAESSATGHEY